MIKCTRDEEYWGMREYWILYSLHRYLNHLGNGRSCVLKIVHKSE